MKNIYSFLYFTLSLSILAGFLLILKRVLRDKLSPRWQYGVWWLLILRALFPLMGTGRELTAPALQLVELIKQLAEPSLRSVYTDFSTVTTVLFAFPFQNKLPASFTDRLLLVYAAGVLFSIFWYGVCYFRLRKQLKKGRSASAEMMESLERVCKAYNLSSCDVCEVNGLPSALICGVFKPILAIPVNTIPADAVLLHELLHLHYKDALHNVIWCIFKALNWCNPFLRYVCRLAGNDLETLCDHRVLERLEGESRREYGLTLLSMANEKYARAPGTTSLSNGGRFIAHRIEAIARFKHYPKGMSLVSCCMFLLLAVTFFFGNMTTTTLFDSPKYVYGGTFDKALAQSSARLYSPGTLAGALDTLAKGMLDERRIWVAAAARPENQSEIFSAEEDPWLPYNHQMLFNTGYAYEVYNISHRENGIFTGLIIYKIDGLPDDPDILENARVEWYAVYPFRAGNSQGRWWAELDGQPYRQMILGNDLFQLPCTVKYHAEGKTGSAAVYARVTTAVNGSKSEGAWFATQVSAPPNPNAEFARMMYEYRYEYQCTEDPAGMTRATMLVTAIDNAEDVIVFEDPAYQNGTEDSPYVTASSNNGAASVSQLVLPNWNGILTGGGGRGYGGSDIETDDLAACFPHAYAVRIVLSGQVAEDLYLKKEVQ